MTAPQPLSLAALLTQLSDELPPFPPIPAGTTWESALESALSACDRSVRWRLATPIEVFNDANRAHPAITRNARGWWVLGLDGGLVRLVDDAEHVSHHPLAALGHDTLAWAIAEPTLPMQILGGEHSPWRRVWALLQDELPDLRSLLIYAAVAGLLGLATPLMVQVLVNTVAFGTVQLPLFVMVLLLTLGLTAGAALRVLERYVVELLQRRLFARTVVDLAARLPRIHDKVHHKAAPTEIVNRFFDVLTAQKSLSLLLLDGIDAALQTVMGLLLLALYHPALLGFDVLMIGALIAVLFGMSRRATETAITESKAKHAVAAWLEEIAANPQMFRGHGGPEHAQLRADHLIKEWLRQRSSHFRAFLTQHGAALALQVLASTGLLALGGALVLQQQLSLGQLVAAELVVTSVLLAFGKLTDKMEAAYDLVAAIDKIGHVMELPRLRATGWTTPAHETPAALLFDGLLVEGGVPPVDLQVEAGQTLALVVTDDSLADGVSGVLAGVRVAQAGAVRVDAVAIDDLSLRALRRDVALLRRGEVVSGTVADNLMPGGVHKDIEAMQAALDRVGMTRSGPHAVGPGTKLGPMGAPLSEVDRIRLTIARALLGPQRVQVVDRILDGLPPAEAARLLAELVADGRTTLLLTAHRGLAARLPRQLVLSPHGLTPMVGRA